MLKSYKQLSRWYGALEPETGAPAPAGQDEASSPPPGDEEGPARYPHYIREEDPEEARARAEVPTDLPARRSEFVGGWSDWVADRAPGPYDDYAPQVSSTVRFPWPEDDFDEDDHHDEPRTRSTPALRTAAREHPGSRRTRVLLVLVAAVLLLALAGAIALWLLQSSGERGAAGSGPASMQFTAGSVQSGPIADCPTERGAGLVRSADPGGTESGPDAVLAFQYAYYVERSGEQARAIVAPDAAISPAEVIQRGIDSIPAGTTHCVRVLTIADNKYSVEVTEYRPGGVPATYNKQTVTTAVIGGRTLITGIAAG
ncbi:hypothetical protein [Nocardia sp. NPDC050710]|uniref:hypothetical protein n=1 Tax=Nocardia sp. NPDC050710 TaxID=3157220 RepID=UPI00340CA57B